MPKQKSAISIIYLLYNKVQWFQKSKSTRKSWNLTLRPKFYLTKCQMTPQRPLSSAEWRPTFTKKSEINNWTRLRLKKEELIKSTLLSKAPCKAISQKNQIKPKPGLTNLQNSTSKPKLMKLIPTNSDKFFTSRSDFLLLELCDSFTLLSWRQTLKTLEPWSMLMYGNFCTIS